MKHLSCMLAAAAALVFPVRANLGGTTYSIPNVLQNGSVTAQGVSTRGNLDGQKMLPGPNETTADWWYFDAVSTTSANESITIVFSQGGPESLVLSSLPVLQLSVSGSFANGSLFSYAVPVADDGFAVIHTGADGLSVEGVWTGSGFSFAGTAPGGTYTVRIDALATIGVKGTLTLQGVAPGHYPCGPAVAGQSELVGSPVGVPGLYWANAIPDAIAIADFTIAGQRFSWAGWGYHDQNWITEPLYEAVQSWIWGHVHVGPYSAVWFDANDYAGVEYQSGYVAKDGQIIAVSCSSQSVTARGYGPNGGDDFPPTINSPAPAGMLVRFGLDGGKTLVVNVTTDLITDLNPVYVRAIGKATAHIEGGHGLTGQVFQGKSLWDEFKFPL